jgi:hypothetical protein
MEGEKEQHLEEEIQTDMVTLSLSKTRSETQTETEQETSIKDLEQEETDAFNIPMVPLKLCEDYLIERSYPNRIFHKISRKYISEYRMTNGYEQVKINGTLHYKHRILANQFFDYDLNDKTKQIDHINHERSDNDLSNLRVISPEINAKNRRKHPSSGVEYEYVDKLPEHVKKIKSYRDIEIGFIFKDLDTGDFYDTSAGVVRKMYVNNPDKNPCIKIKINSLSQPRINIYINSNLVKYEEEE